MLNSILYVSLYAVFNVAGAAIIKSSLTGKQLVTLNDWINFVFTGYFILAFTLIVLSALLLFKGLSLNSFSTIIPIATAINFGLTATVGVFFFNDKLTFGSYIGFTLILAGILMISLNNRTHG